MIVKQRKRITIEAQNDGELDERLAVFLDLITAHGAEILRVDRLVAARPRAQVSYETVMRRGGSPL